VIGVLNEQGRVIVGNARVNNVRPVVMQI